MLWRDIIEHHEANFLSTFRMTPYKRLSPRILRDITPNSECIVLVAVTKFELWKACARSACILGTRCRKQVHFWQTRVWHELKKTKIDMFLPKICWEPKLTKAAYLRFFWGSPIDCGEKKTTNTDFSPQWRYCFDFLTSGILWLLRIWRVCSVYTDKGVKKGRLFKYIGNK